MSTFHQRRIEVAGFAVDVVNFGHSTFYYPSFNGNAEFPATAKGFRALSHYLRTVRYFNEAIKAIYQP